MAEAIALESLTDDQKLSIMAALSPGGAGPIFPTSVIATAGGASGAVDVQWTHRQPGMVASFVITSSAGQSIEVPANGLPRQSARIAGLTNGVAQTFTVRAKNVVGPSLVSPASNAVTPTDAPALFLPVTRALEAWYCVRRQVLQADGAAMASLIDYSGNGYDAAARVGTVNGGTVAPTYKVGWSGGKPAAQLNGNGARFDTQASKLYPGMRSPRATVFAVFSASANPNVSGSQQGRVFSTEGTLGGALRDGGQGFGVGIGAVNDQVNPAWFDHAGVGATTPQIPSTPAVPLGTPARVAVAMPGSFRVGGVEYATSTFPPDGIDEHGALAVWTLGAQWNNTSNRALAGHLAEVIIYYDVLTPAEIAAVEAYLQGAY